MKWYYWVGLGAAAYFLLRGKRSKVRRNPSRAWHEERGDILKYLVANSSSPKYRLYHESRQHENDFALANAGRNPRRRRR